MTSNAGSENRENAMGFAKSAAAANQDKAMKALRAFLRPEFIGRIDEIIVFNELGEAECARIARILIDEFRPALKTKGIELTVDDEVCTLIAKKAAGGSRGARDIRNIIRREVEDEIADLIINATLPVKAVHITVDGDKILVA